MSTYLTSGGVTTDVHSVTTGTEEIERLALAPEPLIKRTAEGDLGVFINAGQVTELLGKSFAKRWRAD